MPLIIVVGDLEVLQFTVSDCIEFKEGENNIHSISTKLLSGSKKNSNNWYTYGGWIRECDLGVVAVSS